MTDPTKKPETDAAGTGNAGAAAKPAGAVAAAPAAAAKPTKPVAPAPAVALTMEPKAKKADAPEPTVVVTGPEKGRWRCGRQFTREPSSIPMSDLKEGELEKLQADPELAVQVIDAPH